MLHRALVITAACCLIPACSGIRQTPAEPAPAAPATVELPQHVGRIAMVSPDKQFVLIQRYLGTRFTQGTILTTTGENHRAANLRLSGESHGSYDAADIQSGDVEVGDSVYLPPVADPPKKQ